LSTPLWDRHTHGEEPSYLAEMLSSQANVHAGLGAIAASALLAIPMGLAGAAVPLVLFAAGETIAALFVPSSAGFRNRVDRKRRAARRRAAQEQLLEEITRIAEDRDKRWAVHSHLQSRAESLRALLERGSRAISEADVERTEDAAVDYLALWLAALTMRERLSSIDPADLDRRLRSVEKMRSNAGSDAKTLEKAQADLADLGRRREQLGNRLTAVETAMLTLPDAVEEIYQAAMAPPSAGETGQRLREAVDRLEIERGLEDSLELDDADLNRRRNAASAMRVRQ
jgi:hypothetical protein